MPSVRQSRTIKAPQPKKMLRRRGFRYSFIRHSPLSVHDGGFPMETRLKIFIFWRFIGNAAQKAEKPMSVF
jgi:hypothetical protein